MRYHHIVTDAYAGPKGVIDVPDMRHTSPLPAEAGKHLAEGMDWLWQTAGL